MLAHVAAQNPSSVVGDHKEAVDYPDRQLGTVKKTSEKLEVYAVSY
jgi:hypothetical protein